jgi:hypothetical protein
VKTYNNQLNHRAYSTSHVNNRSHSLRSQEDKQMVGRQTSVSKMQKAGCIIPLTQKPMLVM